jgi:hypothetical protein
MNLNKALSIDHRCINKLFSDTPLKIWTRFNEPNISPSNYSLTWLYKLIIVMGHCCYLFLDPHTKKKKRIKKGNIRRKKLKNIY